MGIKPAKPCPDAIGDASLGEPASTADELRRLGEELYARREEVVGRIVAALEQRGTQLDPLAARRFERMGTVVTIAVARLMAGSDGDAAHDGDQESWIIFGELAAQRVLPLNEVIRLCLRWRDSAEETVRAITEELGIPRRVCARAIDMLQSSLSVTLVQMGEAFESERRRTEEERTRREEELAFMATHDPLTDLPNRALILDRLEQMLVRARNSGTAVAALFVDLDDFKSINDLYGHEAGDQVLKAVAGRLAGVVRDEDALGRLSGDEFVLLAPEMSGSDGPEVLAERLLCSLSEPIHLSNAPAPVTVTASIGIEMGAQLSPGELVRDADVAMYRAKWAGKNRFYMFERRPGQPGEHDAPRRRRGLRWRLRAIRTLGAGRSRGVPKRRETDAAPGSRPRA